MAVTDEQRARVLNLYGVFSRWLEPAVQEHVEDPAEVIAQGRTIFAGMLDEIPYVDRHGHSMAPSMFACTAMLALFQVLRERGVDAHAWGRALHSLPPGLPSEDPAVRERERERSRKDADASQASAAPNEFVFTIIEGPGFDRGMNIESCAICHLFGKHDAMDLVPYMCAYDDVVSDAAGQGLRRTGTIALGASRCDFRFEGEGGPLRLVEQFPDRIRLDDG
ncbi:MAG: L-2-amino-thiazoline-4-carboxylic acid hydrolase [Myxococcota bacterium]|nr:L-2-amino-thiazoline-4-carboxylic acid hydrolase [Myxococcota bacterium]